MLINFPNGQFFTADCFEVLKNISDLSIDMVLTDIPYGEVNRKSFGLRNFDKSTADCSIDLDIEKLIQEINRVCRGSIYIFCGWKQLSFILSLLQDYSLTTRVGVWSKTNPSPCNGQYNWLSSVELCVFAKKKKAVFNEHCKGSVWECPSPL